MKRSFRIFDRRQLLLTLWAILIAGFLATTLIGYEVSKRAILSALIENELPLTSSNIYSEIQKDLVRPILISSTMASDTFLREWVLRSERSPQDINRYLKEIKSRYNAFSSFFVSDRTLNYYTGDGILKRVSPDEPRDAWYYRVRSMQEPYEINIDPDLANKDALTIFINFRVYDFDNRYIGATGIGLTVDSVRHLITDYQTRYHRTIYFVDLNGNAVLFGNQTDRPRNLRANPEMAGLLEQIVRDRSGSYQYREDGDLRILNVGYIPELKWLLFVEQSETQALRSIRNTLYTNLLLSLLITLIVVAVAHVALSRYQWRIEDMAATDKLTGLLNRQAFAILVDKLMAEFRRAPRPIAVIAADIDHFKSVNDRFGHRAGDHVLVALARIFRRSLRESDIAVRWGGEEFLVVLKGCDRNEALRIAEMLRERMASEAIDVAGEKITVTVSLGVAAFDGNETPDQLIDRADAALYRAKDLGRNRVESAD